MKKRLAKKALRPESYNLWSTPDGTRTFPMPRNGRCWYLIRKACVKTKALDSLEEYVESLNELMEGLKDKRKQKESTD